MERASRKKGGRPESKAGREKVSQPDRKGRGKDRALEVAGISGDVSRRRNFVRAAVAAVLLVLSGVAVYKWTTGGQNGPKPVDDPKNPDGHSELRPISQIPAEIDEALVIMQEAIFRSELEGLLDRAGMDPITDEESREFGESAERLDKMLQLFLGEYPDDEELMVVKILFDDLKADFEAGGAKKIKIDDAYKRLLEFFYRKIAGFNRQDADKYFDQSVMGKFQGLGVDIEYVVPSGDPQAPNVLVFPMMHANLSADAPPDIVEKQKPFVEESQAAIWDDLNAILEAGGSIIFYQEGGVLNEDKNSWTKQQWLDYQQKNAAGGQISSANLATIKLKYGDRVEIRGIENRALYQLQMFLSDYGNPYEQMAMLMARSSVGNAFMVRNMKRQRKSTDGVSVSVLLIGALHEQGLEDQANPLPISSLLAYMGFNAAVVKTPKTPGSEYFLDPGRTQ